MKNLKMILNQEEGQGLVEYALIIGLIAVVAIAALGSMGSSVGTSLNTVSNQISGS